MDACTPLSLLVVGWQRQNQMRWLRAVMQDSLPRRPHLRRRRAISTGIQIALPTRKATARHLHPQGVTGQEDNRGGPKINLDLIAPIWTERFGVRIASVAIAHTGDAVGDGNGSSIRIDVYQPRHKISIRRICPHI